MSEGHDIIVVKNREEVSSHIESMTLTFWKLAKARKQTPQNPQKEIQLYEHL